MALFALGASSSTIAYGLQKYPQLFARFRRKRTSVSPTIVGILFRAYSAKFALATLIYIAILVPLLFLSRFDIALALAALYFANAVFYGVTAYRILSGSFGYNADEMREIASFVAQRVGGGGLPPNTRGLATPAAAKKQAEADDIIGAAVPS